MKSHRLMSVASVVALSAVLSVTTAYSKAPDGEGPDAGNTPNGVVGVQDTVSTQPAPACAGCPTRPRLLTPIHGHKIKQNDPDIGCPFLPGRGYGFQIFFDWTRSTSPNGIAGYQIVSKNVNAEFPIVDTFVPASQFTYTSCNGFVIDSNLDGWQWSVRAQDNQGVFGPWARVGTYAFKPCRLDDGSACFAN